MLTGKEYSELEEIIFNECGINIKNLEDNQQINPNKIIISQELNEKIIDKIRNKIDEWKSEDLGDYKSYDNVNIRLLLANIGPNVDVNNQLEDDVKLLKGHIITH